jgi:hypothetical protein
VPNSEHFRFPGHRATFGGARAAWRGPVGPNRPWPEGGVVGSPAQVRSALMEQYQWARVHMGACWPPHGGQMFCDPLEGVCVVHQRAAHEMPATIRQESGPAVVDRPLVCGRGGVTATGWALVRLRADESLPILPRGVRVGRVWGHGSVCQCSHHLPLHNRTCPGSDGGS